MENINIEISPTAKRLTTLTGGLTFRKARQIVLFFSEDDPGEFSQYQVIEKWKQRRLICQNYMPTPLIFNINLFPCHRHKRVKCFTCIGNRQFHKQFKLD